MIYSETFTISIVIIIETTIMEETNRGHKVCSAPPSYMVA
jgi:hypothetical protein